MLALDGSNWQRVDLFDFQTDIEVCPVHIFLYDTVNMYSTLHVGQMLFLHSDRFYGHACLRHANFDLS